MAIGQITLIDLNDTRTGSLSLDSNHPRIQTYDPGTGKYNPDYENEELIIRPQFILGNESIEILETQITYTINNKELDHSDLAGGNFYKKGNQLHIKQNLIVDYYHIEALVIGLKDGEVDLPPFSASYDISKLSDGSSQGDIKFTANNNNLIIVRADGTYDPEEITLSVDFSNYDFGDKKPDRAYLYYGAGEIFQTIEKDDLSSGIIISNPILTEAMVEVNATEFAVAFFNGDEELAYRSLTLNILNDGSIGKDAYSLIIDNNQPVIVCREENENYYAIEDGEDSSIITLLDGDKKKVEISRAFIEGEVNAINDITFSTSIQNGSVLVKLNWIKDTLIKKTTARIILEFEDSSLSLTASITVLPLTGGKNGENGQDSCILILEAEPSDQFTPNENGNITIKPFFYVGNDLIDSTKLSYEWSILGQENGDYIGERYVVSQEDVETQEVYICKVTYNPIDEEPITRTSRITIKNTLAPYYCEISCLGGNTFKNGKAGNAILKCTVYKTGAGIIAPPNVSYRWYALKDENSKEIIELGTTTDPENTLTLPSNFYIRNTKTIFCEVSF